MWCTLGFLQQSLRDKLQFFGGGGPVAAVGNGAAALLSNDSE